MIMDKYCFDAGAFLECWIRLRPYAMHRQFWDQISTLIDGGRLRSPSEVQVELRKQHEDLVIWARNQSDLFVPFDDELQSTLIKILSKGADLVDTCRSAYCSEPFSLALCMEYKLVYVTGEPLEDSKYGLTLTRVCEEFQIRRLSIEDFLAVELM